MSKVQVLVAAMNQDDHSLLTKMNIQSDAIVGNQCNRNEIHTFDYNNYTITYLNFNERGVGLNRNNALMRASGEICLFADDDLRYVDNYPEIVCAAFTKHPEADVIVFNIYDSSGRYVNKRDFRVGYLNFMRYGAARIAVKSSFIKEKGIYFNLNFGGGTAHGHGEDLIFLNSCLKNKAKVFASADYIATLLDNRESTWFHGYDDKFFYDHGILIKTLFPLLWKPLCVHDSWKHKKKYGKRFHEIYKAMTDI